ncbi:NHL repeat-containing protein [Pontibacter fetidus]|uniref:SdiA-regulated protein n=1 Tax=Pontibacter fetidus TaxID=2700082 RepID=A0A6B2HB54_9BACT|nr:hypothetical protein [Pontibacter fetidus]NDK57640.1 hypothetical protein [Pontibacter fetidus]
MKLMIKIFIVFASILAIAIYFFRDQETPAGTVTNSNASEGNFETLAPLPTEVKESSGIESMPDQGHYITHNDANNKPYLYEIDEKGKLVKTYKLRLPNVDWEDLTRDTNGNLYISDTGNNNNKRRELAIYKTSFQDLQKPQAIRFTYQDQKGKSSKKDKKSYDCEALFWYDGNLYLLTKDRNGENKARIYQLPDTPGNHIAKPIGSIAMKEPVTSAAISPDAGTIALLSEGKIHLYRNVSSPETFYEGDAEEITLTGAGQTEAITFKDDNTLILTSEGGSLFRYKL